MQDERADIALLEMQNDESEYVKLIVDELLNERE